MNCGDLKEIIKNCKDTSDVIIFVSFKNGDYKPFSNIDCAIFNSCAFNEELHLNIGELTEYHSSHFLDNPTKEFIEDLKEKRCMLIEELNEIEDLLGAFK